MSWPAHNGLARNMELVASTRGASAPRPLGTLAGEPPWGGGGRAGRGEPRNTTDYGHALAR